MPRENGARGEGSSFLCPQLFFHLCFLLSFSFLLLSPMVFVFRPNDFFFALLLASPLPSLIFFWTHQHFHTLSLPSWEERRSRDEIVRTTFLSIADRVEVFNARSFLNYSWKRQIRRPFSVRAYGNGDKSDLTAVFLSTENIRSPNFRFLSLFLIFSLRFFLLPYFWY